MKASRAIEILQKYHKPDEEVFFGLWANDSSYYRDGKDIQLTDEQWKKVVEKLEDLDNIFEDVIVMIDEYAEPFVEENRNATT